MCSKARQWVHVPGCYPRSHPRWSVGFSFVGVLPTHGCHLVFVEVGPQRVTPVSIAFWLPFLDSPPCDCDMSDELADSQRQLISLLPASSQTLADELHISTSTVRDRISRLRDSGVAIQYDNRSQMYVLADEEKVRRVSTKHTGTKTREANNYITELEKTILRRLEASQALITPQDPEPGNEDMVLHVTDLHIGDVVENEHGNEVYNTAVAKRVMNHITEKVLHLRKTMSAISNFDTLHILYGGDMVTNENIYDGQAYDIESMLADQMTDAVAAMTNQIKSLASEFEALNVVAIPGNHGKTRASGVSKQANMDLVAYRWLDDRLREAKMDNIDMNVGEATWHKTFELRGGEWTGFLVHGQDQQQHVDATAASSRDWRGHLNKFELDVGYRGHYHSARVEPIQNGPFVIESPSPKPAGEFAEQIGESSVDGIPERLATIHGVSDSRPITWLFHVDDSSMS